MILEEEVFLELHVVLSEESCSEAPSLKQQRYRLVHAQSYFQQTENVRDKTKDLSQTHNFEISHRKSSFSHTTPLTRQSNLHQNFPTPRPRNKELANVTGRTVLQKLLTRSG